MAWWLLLSLVLVGFFWAGCPCCGPCGGGTVACTPCLDSPTGVAKKAVIAGVANGNCSTCDDLNGTYFLCADSQTPSTCDWELLFSACACAFGRMRSIVQSSFPAAIAVGIQFTDATDGLNCGGGSADSSEYRKGYPTGQNPDCDEIDMDIPWSSTFSTTGAKAECDFTASTCILSNV